LDDLELHKPGLAERLHAHIQTGRFHDADELIEKALDALEGKGDARSAQQGRRRAGRKSLVEVFTPLRGLNLDFSRDKSTGRTVNFS
jgi:Arc/MetJ-type ribon-helix-helix transcriptional regulator